MAGHACTLVFDVGKTHVKTSLLDTDGNVDVIWHWLGEQVLELSEDHIIKAISIATHGATAALVDVNTEALLLPVMDYEFDDYPELPEDYDGLRDIFAKTGSPPLPAGLNLGRQLHWQSTLLDKADKTHATLLFYPQYWSWRLTGRMACEPTSLGCHTDLWDLQADAPTDLLTRFGLGHALPPCVKPWEPLGHIRPDIAKAWNLPEDCLIWPGLHDSNAGYAPYLRIPKAERPTIISTGTWAVIMDGDAALDTLDPARDMLINLDATGAPLATARYMGGREFERVCELLNADMSSTFTIGDIETIINSEILILPCFASGTGPYPAGYGRATNNLINGKAGATLYSALMLADIVTRLTPNTTRPIVVEGSFAQNDVLCGLLAALLPHRSVQTQITGSGVVEGCFAMTRWDNAKPPQAGTPVAQLDLPGLSTYANSWTERVNNRRGFQP